MTREGPGRTIAQPESGKVTTVSALLGGEELHSRGAGDDGVAEGVGDADRVGRVHQGLVISAGVDPVSKIVSVHRP